MNISIFYSCVLLLLGLLMLWKTGDWSVKNAVRFSAIYRIESFAIGFFIFAVCTGLPEITSAVVSSLEGVPELSAGNLIGATFVNLCLQLGIASILAKNLVVDLRLRKRLIFCSSLVLLIMLVLIFKSIGSKLLGGFLVALYVISLFQMQKDGTAIEEFKDEFDGTKTFLPPKLDVLCRLIGSLSLLILSSWLAVTSAVSVAKFLNVPLAIIGGTVIAVGTALPELTLEIHAIRKKEFGLVLGDIFGSSLLNVSIVLGLLVFFNASLNLSIAKIVFPFFAPVIFWIFYHLIRNKPFRLVDGVIFVSIFFLYILRAYINHSFYI